MNDIDADFEEFKKLMIETTKNLKRLKEISNTYHFQIGGYEEHLQAFEELKKEMSEATRMYGWISSTSTCY